MTVRVSNHNEDIPYNVDNALYLLGPRNYGIDELKGCFHCLSAMIQNIVITILRVFNYICGDGLWYNNEIARDIVQTYYNQAEGSTEMTARVNELYQELQYRFAEEGSYASTISLPSQIRLSEENTSLDFSDVPPTVHVQDADERIRKRFQRGETGNRTLLQIAKHLIEGREHSNDEIRQLLPVLENNIKQNQYFFPERVDVPPGSNLHELYTHLYNSMSDIYCPRLYQPSQGENVEAIVSSKNPDYEKAKDPYELFYAALFDALVELGINATTLQTGNFLESPKMQQACCLAIYNLLLQADICDDDCEGPYVKFNEFLTARYQKPTIAYFFGRGTELEPKPIFKTDLFSSTEIGCDPEGAKRFLHTYEETQLLASCKDHLIKDAPPSLDSMNLFKVLVTTMARQIKDRYGKKLIPMLIKKLRKHPSESPPPPRTSDFHTYTEKADTPWQLIKLGTTWTAQHYASLGLLNHDDLYDASAIVPLKTLICRTAILKILQNAQPIHDFRIKLSKNLEVNCEKYFAFLPTPENPQMLSPVLRYIPNAFGGDGTEDDLPGDLIKASFLLNKLTPPEMAFFERYICASQLKRLYQLKGIRDSNALDIDLQARRELSQMPISKQRLIQDLFTEISSIESYVAEKYFNMLCPEILSTIQIPNNALPTVVTFIPPAYIDRPIFQNVQWMYLPGVSHDEVTIKSRASRAYPPRIPVIGKNYTQGSLDIDHQNNVIENHAQYGNCLFGALALEIFETNAPSNIEFYSQILRQASADYIWDHQEQFRNTMILDSDHPDRGETDEAFQQRMFPILNERLRQRCHNTKTTLSWGSGIDIEAVAGIFGVPIHIFNCNRPMQIGRDGIERGMIQPNSILGGRFSGAPIRLKYTGNHYRPIRLML